MGSRRIYQLGTMMLVSLVCLDLAHASTSLNTIQERTVSWPGSELETAFLSPHYLNTYEDVTGTQSLEDILGQPDIFHPTTNILPIYTFTKSAIWTQLSIYHTSSTAQTIALNTNYGFFDEFSVFLVGPDGQEVFRWQGGANLPFYERPIKNRAFVIPLELEPDTHYTLYTRMASDEAIIIAQQISSLDYFKRRDREEQIITGLLYGAILIMLAYNLMLFASTRERGYGLYCVYLAFYGLFLFSFRGYGYEYLWPDSPLLQKHSLTIFGPIATAALVLFTQDYLNTKESSPRHHRNLTILFYFCLCHVPLCLFIPGALANTLITAGIIGVSVYFIGLGMTMWRQGYQAARYYVLAFVVNLSAYIYSAMSLLRQEGYGENFVTKLNGLHMGLLEFGVLLEMVLLSVGVGYRITLLRQEAQELQELNFEFTARAQKELEHEVERQTQELRSTLQTLESTQNEMVHQARLATVGNLVTGLAHEIGNPLNLTLGGAQELTDLLSESEATLTADAPELKDQLENCSGLIIRGSERIESIVRNLNRLAQTGQRPTQESCDIVDIIEMTLEIIAHRLEQEQIEVAVSDFDLPRARANSGELSQVILNLILNACDAMGRGGQIFIDAEKASNHIYLNIRDDGPGIPPEVGDHIFDAFFTTKDQGTGLGLAISHQMVASWNGQLSLCPSESGAHFRITLQPFDEET